METVTQHMNEKTELEERIRMLELEKSSLLSDLSSLKEKLATLELERYAASLDSEVEALRTEKVS
jgi:hypothetical protein